MSKPLRRRTSHMAFEGLDEGLHIWKAVVQRGVRKVDRDVAFDIVNTMHKTDILKILIKIAAGIVFEHPGQVLRGVMKLLCDRGQSNRVRIVSVQILQNRAELLKAVAVYLAVFGSGLYAIFFKRTIK